MTIAILLTVCCFVLFVPVPIVLANARWTQRAPIAAVTLWQAIGLAGSISAFGAGLAVAIEPMNTSVTGGVSEFFDRAVYGGFFQHLGLTGAFGLTISTDVLAAIFTCVGVTMYRTAKARRRHRRLLDLVGEQDERVPGSLLLRHPSAVAYCIPGMRSRIVFSVGAIEALPDELLQAVSAHERGHAHGRHDLVMLPFASMVEALRMIPYARVAPAAVAELLEMAADDFACRTHQSKVVADALVRLVEAGAVSAPKCAFSASSVSVGRRVARLVQSDQNSRSAACLGLLGAGLVIALPIAAFAAPPSL